MTGLSFEQAAAVPRAGVLALQGLLFRAELRAGDAVLINGAGGGVGTFTIQLATASGAAVTGVDSASKLDAMRSLGAGEVIDYRRERFSDRRGRYDWIVDVVLRGSVIARSRALRPGGAYSVIGGHMRRILQAVAIGPLLPVPVIDSTYALKDARRAFERFGTGDDGARLEQRRQPLERLPAGPVDHEAGGPAKVRSWMSTGAAVRRERMTSRPAPAIRPRKRHRRPTLTLAFGAGEKRSEC